MAQEHRLEPMDDTAEPRLGSWWFAVVPAITLLVGLVLGGLVVGVTVDGEPESRTTSTPTPVDPSPTEDVAVVVPQECLEAAETVQEATALIRDGASAIREFRPDELITLLDDLEDLDAVAREQATACEEVDVSRTP
jgi:hypothetical protein